MEGGGGGWGEKGSNMSLPSASGWFVRRLFLATDVQ